MFLPEPIHDNDLEVSIEVEFDNDAPFIVFDEKQRRFHIEKSKTTIEDIGIYYTWITLVDTVGNTSKRYPLVLAVLEQLELEEIIDT